MDKQTKTILLIGGGLAVLYFLKNRGTRNNYSGNGVDTNQGDYSSNGGGMGAPDARGDMGGSGFVASGDDDTVSIANDPSTSFTGNVTGPAIDSRPIVGDVMSGLSAKPTVGKPSTATKLPAGGKKLMTKGRQVYR